MERIFQDYGSDGFFPIMLMYDGTSAQSMAMAEELNLTFPILNDTGLEVFDRLDPSGATPKSTFLDVEVVVHSVEVAWYPGMIEEILYGEE